MNAADTVNVFGMILKVVEQDPISFMVVYPMSLMTTSVLFYVLFQDFIPAYKAGLAPITERASLKKDRSSR